MHGYAHPTTGYGTSGLAIAHELLARNVSLHFHPVFEPSEKVTEFFTPEMEQVLATLPERIPQRPSRNYLGYFVPTDVPHKHWTARKARTALLLTTFETTRVPEHWAARINAYDGLLVTCEGLVGAFTSAGVTVPIRVVTLGVDVDDWAVQERNWEVGRTPDSPFRFLMYADALWNNHRKGYDAATWAFAQAFPVGGPVHAELWIKVSQHDEYVQRVVSSAPRNVRVVNQTLSQPGLVDLLRAAHCLVFPSHGEGFGLPVREAMATGIPAIVLGFMGLERVGREETALPVPFHLAPAQGFLHLLRAELSTRSADGEDTPAAETNVHPNQQLLERWQGWLGDWAVASDRDIAEQMLRAVASPQEVRRRGMRAARFVRQFETVHHAVDDVLLAFARASAQPVSCPDTL